MGRLMEHWEMTLKKHKTLKPHGHYVSRLASPARLDPHDRFIVVMEVDGEVIPLANDQRNSNCAFQLTTYGLTRTLYSDKRELAMLKVLNSTMTTCPANMFPLRKCAKESPAPKLKWKPLVKHWENLMKDAKFYLVYGAKSPHVTGVDRSFDTTFYTDLTWVDYGCRAEMMVEPQPIEMYGEVVMELSLDEDGFIPQHVKIPLFHDVKMDILPQEMVNRMKWKGHTVMMETRTAKNLSGVSQ